MNLNEIRFNTVFEYIKDIRRYSYEIEDFLKSQNLCDNVNPSVPLPDEIEPLAERLTIVKNFDDKVYIIGFSQVTISVVFRYKNDNVHLDNISKETAELEKVVEKIVDFLSKKIPNFKVIFEGLILGISTVSMKKEDIKILDVDDSTDEKRTKLAQEIDNEFIMIEETTVLKSYRLTTQTISPFAIKNKKENFIGWNVILFKELNNRLYYNYNDDSGCNRLNIATSSKMLENKFRKDLGL